MRPITLTTDYKELALWWKLQSWPVPPAQDILPPTGLIIKGKAAGFLYLTDTPIAWLEFIVANPLCDILDRGKALDSIINGLLLEAKKKGKVIVFTSTNNQRLSTRLETLGATLGDSATNQYIWRL